MEGGGIGNIREGEGSQRRSPWCPSQVLRAAKGVGVRGRAWDGHHAIHHHVSRLKKRRHT